MKQEKKYKWEYVEYPGRGTGRWERVQDGNNVWDAACSILGTLWTWNPIIWARTLVEEER
jgi:hypothetical protein